MTILKTALKLLKRTRRNEIPLNSFLHEIMDATGNQYKLSVKGTIAGHSPGKLFSHPYFVKSWIHVPRHEDKLGFNQTMLLRRSKYPSLGTTTTNYDSIAKMASRRFILESFVGEKNTKILTMAGSEGLCVKYFKSKIKGAHVTNVEYLPHVLEDFKKTKVGRGCTNILGNINTYVTKTSDRFDLFFFDTTTGLCDQVSKTMLACNNKMLAKEISINLLDVKRVKNRGTFVDFIKKNYYKYEDPVLSYLKDSMSNYEFSGEFKYQRFENSRKMRVLKFRLISDVVSVAS